MLSDPPLVWRVVAPDDPDMYDQARREQAGASRLRRLFGKQPARPAAEFTLSEGEGHDTDLDKSWHGIHYLLTGTASGGDRPRAFLVDGGRPAGDVDVGYGPARLFTSAETRSILEALEQLTVDELRHRACRELRRRTPSSAVGPTLPC